MLRSPLIRAAALAGFAMHLTVLNASGQETQPGTQRPASPETETPRPSQPEQSPLPVLPSYPVELFGLLAPPVAPLALVPALAVSEEWNSNVNFDNTNPQSDFITGVTPVLMLFVHRPRYNLLAGVSSTAELYAKNSSQNNIFARSAVILGGTYTASQNVTLRLSDTFGFDRGANPGGWQSFTTGQLALNNRFSPGLTWLMPQATLDFSATYEINRFPGSDDSVDSDTYGFRSNLNYSFTPRFGGILEYAFTFLRLQGGDDSATHAPTVGFSYQLTKSLIFRVNGGPAITQIRGETFISPAGGVNLTQQWQIGSLTLQYDRGVSTAGGFGGSTDHQTAAATFLAATWIRDLVARLNFSYDKAVSLNSGQTTQQVDVTSYAAGFGVAYLFSPYVSVFGGYDYRRQRTGPSATTQVDGDQHRVKIGVQLGYPIPFN